MVVPTQTIPDGRKGSNKNNDAKPGWLKAYDELGKAGKFVLWTVAAAGALYMAVCAAPRHMNYRQADRPSNFHYQRTGKEFKLNDKVIACEDAETANLLEKRINRIRAKTDGTEWDKANAVIEDLGGIIDDDLVEKYELGPFKYRFDD